MWRMSSRRAHMCAGRLPERNATGGGSCGHAYVGCGRRGGRCVLLRATSCHSGSGGRRAKIPRMRCKCKGLVVPSAIPVTEQSDIYVRALPADAQTGLCCQQLVARPPRILPRDAPLEPPNTRLASASPSTSAKSSSSMTPPTPPALCRNQPRPGRGPRGGREGGGGAGRPRALQSLRQRCGRGDGHGRFQGTK